MNDQGGIEVSLPTHIGLCPKCAEEFYYPLNEQEIKRWIKDAGSVHCPVCSCPSPSLIVYVREGS